MINYKQNIINLAEQAGIGLNGNEPWDIQVQDDAIYKRIALHGTLGLGEGYMEGMWECERLDLLFEKILRANVEKTAHFSFSVVFLLVAYLVTNLQTIARSTKVAEVHYDISNEFYKKMLDKRMMYTCGYWMHANNLEDAQTHKLKLICEKLQLEKGETLLDIGCGWGGLAEYAAEHYGVQVTGVTISKQQAAMAKERCKHLPVDILLLDYRKVEGQFDKIVSMGMFEHVGPRNYRTYMEVVNDKLKEDGLFLLHTIGHRYRTFTADPWVNKYIFPNGKIPYINHVSRSINGLFILEDWHNFGMDYGDTLEAWYNNFEKSWPTFAHEYDETFYRMWKYYLQSFTGAFRARHMQLWQLVLTKPVRKKRYHSIRH